MSGLIRSLFMSNQRDYKICRPTDNERTSLFAVIISSVCFRYRLSLSVHEVCEKRKKIIYYEVIVILFLIPYTRTLIWKVKKSSYKLHYSAITFFCNVKSFRALGIQLKLCQLGIVLKVKIITLEFDDSQKR